MTTATAARATCCYRDVDGYEEAERTSDWVGEQPEEALCAHAGTLIDWPTKASPDDRAHVIRAAVARWGDRLHATYTVEPL